MTAKGEAAVKLVFDACLFYGSLLSTAHKVCALVAEDIEWWEAKRSGPITNDGSEM